ncbi:MAG: hypothetical protein KTR29_16385 [Rhodothermaceae bacterium]|nr:hypothetical protein [Rhodothermaceae bacterium]
MEHKPLTRKERREQKEAYIKKWTLRALFYVGACAALYLCINWVLRFFNPEFSYGPFYDETLFILVVITGIFVVLNAGIIIVAIVVGIPFLLVMMKEKMRIRRAHRK